MEYKRCEGFSQPLDVSHDHGYVLWKNGRLLKRVSAVNISKKNMLSWCHILIYSICLAKYGASGQVYHHGLSHE